MRSKIPDAAPIPDRPPLHLRGGYLCVAAPVSLTEAIFSAPAIRALRHFRPQSTMAVVCPEPQAALWEIMPELNEVIVYEEKASPRQISKQIKDRRVQFESAIVWEASEAAIACQRAGILQRLGYPAKRLAKYLTDEITVVTQPGPVVHRVRYYLDLIQQLGANPFVRQTFQTPAIAPPPEKPLIALSPASEFGVTHQWPLGKFKELVDTVEQKYGGAGSIDWVILANDSASNTTSVNSELENVLEGRAKNYTIEWDGKKTLAALPYCSALVSSDNELAHLAAHVGLPAVVVLDLTNLNGRGR